tara:strand:+ start:2004 stop:4109 length:2106 start_codon:yes stop_codon:yes gene_type:complete
VNASPEPDRLAKRRANLKKLVNARSIAFVGGRQAASAISYCKAIGFEGDVWAVNPKQTEVDGVPCFHSVKDLPSVPDATWVAVSTERTIETIADLNAMGAPSAVVYTAGFSETGDGELERQLIDAAGDMAVVGPNCIGVVNYLDGVPIALTPGLGVERPDHGVALIAQSGTIIGNMVFSERSLPISHLFSMGNQSVTEIADAVDVLADDPRVDAILLYIEGLRDASSFAQAATRSFNHGKPLIALKAGVSEMGRELALTHTGSLAGSPELYDALFDRLGIIKADTFPELLEMSKLFAHNGVPQGNRLLVETCSGTDSGYCADLAERHGVDLPALSEPVRQAVAEVIPTIATASNPLDVTMEQWGDRLAQAKSLVTMLAEPADAAALVINFPSRGDTTSYDPAAEAMLDVKAATDLPCYVITNLPEGAPDWMRTMLAEHGIITLQGMEDAFACIGKGARYVTERDALAAVGGPETRLLSCSPLEAIGSLSEAESKSRLGAFGLPVPESALCNTAGDAVRAARAMGLPVVVKGHGEELAHKSELGAVAVNLGDEKAVHDAATAILALQGIEQVLVDAMVTDAVAEIIVGIKRDATLGMGLMLGSGGILTELMRDTMTLLLPTTPEAIGVALGRLRGYQLLTGFRDRPAGDVEALIAAVSSVAAFAEAHVATLQELDINPIMVRPEGKGVMAVDALVRMGKPQT